MTPPPQIDRQREHQANERTFLAWLRTAIALIGFGFAIARFGLFLQEIQTTVASATTEPQSFLGSQAIGLGLVIVGLVVIGLAVWRYNKVFWQIEHSAYKPSRLMVWITAAIVMILGLLAIPFVMLRQRPQAVQLQPRSDITPTLQRFVATLLPHGINPN